MSSVPFVIFVNMYIMNFKTSSRLTGFINSFIACNVLLQYLPSINNFFNKNSHYRLCWQYYQTAPRRQPAASSISPLTGFLFGTLQQLSENIVISGIYCYKLDNLQAGPHVINYGYYLTINPRLPINHTTIGSITLAQSQNIHLLCLQSVYGQFEKPPASTMFIYSGFKEILSIPMWTH